MTTKYQRDKQKFIDAAKEAGVKAEAAYTEAEEGADKLIEEGEGILAKLRKSGYTAATATAVIGGAALLAFWLIR